MCADESEYHPRGPLEHRRCEANARLDRTMQKFRSACQRKAISDLLDLRAQLQPDRLPEDRPQRVATFCQDRQSAKSWADRRLHDNYSSPSRLRSDHAYWLRIEQSIVRAPVPAGCWLIPSI